MRLWGVLFWVFGEKLLVKSKKNGKSHFDAKRLPESQEDDVAGRAG